MAEEGKKKSAVIFAQSSIRMKKKKKDEGSEEKILYKNVQYTRAYVYAMRFARCINSCSRYKIGVEMIRVNNLDNFFSGEEWKRGEKKSKDIYDDDGARLELGRKQASRKSVNGSLRFLIVSFPCPLYDFPLHPLCVCTSTTYICRYLYRVYHYAFFTLGRRSTIR